MEREKFESFLLINADIHLEFYIGKESKVQEYI